MMMMAGNIYFGMGNLRRNHVQIYILLEPQLQHNALFNSVELKTLSIHLLMNLLVPCHGIEMDAVS